MTPAQVFKHFGGVRATARRLKLSAPSVHNWSKRDEVPALRQAQLHLLTKGKLKISQSAKIELCL